MAKAAGKKNRFTSCLNTEYKLHCVKISAAVAAAFRNCTLHTRSRRY